MDDMKDILAELRKPFPPEHIEWKPQSKTKAGDKAWAAAFVDARRYQDRLDEADPNWTARYEFLKDDGSGVICHMTVGSVTRSDIGAKDEGGMNVETSTIAQAFKRAATTFGLGRDLYLLPTVAWPIDEYGKFKSTPPLPSWYLDKCEGKPAVAKPVDLAQAKQDAADIFGEAEAEPEPAPVQQTKAPTFGEWVKDTANRKSWWAEVKKLGYDEATLHARLEVEHLDQVMLTVDEVWRKLASYCTIHACEMQERTNKANGEKFFSHKTDDGGWCSGKKKGA